MVSARHLIGAGIVVSAAVVVGCASKATRQKAPSAAASTNVSPDGAPTRPAAGPDPLALAGDSAAAAGTEAPRSLAQHTEVYARNLESMLSQRGGAAEGDAAAHSTLPAAGAAPPETGVEGAAGADESAPVEPLANTGMAISAPEPVQQVALAQPRQGVAAQADPSVASERVPAEAAAKDSWERVLSANAPQPQQSNAAAQPAAAQPAGAQSAGAKAAAKPPQGAIVPEELRKKVESKIKDDPRDTAGHLDYQLLQFLLDEPVPKLDAITPLPAEDRELLTTLLDGLANFRNGLRAEANMLQSKKVAPLLELAERLRGQGDLSLPTALLCSRVQRFGVYDPMDPPRFVAGRKDNNAILYCEVANFASQLTADKLWETKLKQEAVLYSETGLAVWSDKSDTVTDLSRKRLHDFFIADKVRIPDNLPVGRYLLKMTVTDLHANRVAEATVPVQIVAQ